MARTSCPPRKCTLELQFWTEHDLYIWDLILTTRLPTKPMLKDSMDRLTRNQILKGKVCEDLLIRTCIVYDARSSTVLLATQSPFSEQRPTVSWRQSGSSHCQNSYCKTMAIMLGGNFAEFLVVTMQEVLHEPSISGPSMILFRRHVICTQDLVFPISEAAA